MKPRDHLSLSTEQQKQVDDITSNLRLLAYCSPGSLVALKSAVDAEISKAQASLGVDTSTPAAKNIAQNMATSLKVDTTAAVALKAATDKRVVASIPKELLTILRVLHGDDDGKIAFAYLDTQRLKREGKLPA